MRASRAVVFAAVALVAMGSAAVARIGESFEQCTHRYGKHVRISDDGEVYVFESAGFRVFAEFDDGKVDRIAYKKLSPTKDYVGPPIQISTPEIHALLEKNFGCEKWETSHPDLYTVVYKCPENKMSALYSTLTGRLIILTDAAGEHILKTAQGADKKTPEAPGLEGL